MLFERLPDGLFGPLAAPNRRHYWQLLMRLFDEFFGPDAPLPPSQGYPRRDITAALERYLLSDDPWENEDGLAPDSPRAARAQAIYERFRQAGWLRQERLGARDRVLMPPLITQLLNLLCDFIERGPAYIGAKVRAIELLLQQVRDGRALGDTLDEAASQARQLLSQVSAISLQVRDLMPELGKAESTAAFVRELFRRYVSELFIGDYADLYRSDHPLARRAVIIGMARELEQGERHQALLKWYAEQGCDPAQAQARLQRSLRRLGELERIDEYLARLDEDMRHANRRALAFLDYRLRSPDRLQALIEHAIARLQQLPRSAPQASLRLPVPGGPLLAEARLRAPRRKPRPIPRSANSLQRPSPEQIARMRLLKRIQRARLVLPDDLARYLAPFRAAGEVHSDRLPLHDIPAIRAYQTLLTLALRSTRPGGLQAHDPLRRHLRGFSVQLLPAQQSRHAQLHSQAFLIRFSPSPGPGKSA